MAVSITPGEVAVAIRAASDKDAVPAPVAAVIAFIAAAAVELVNRYAPEAPEAVGNMAVVRVAGWMWDSEPGDARLGAALEQSGAASLLSQWRVHRAGMLPIGNQPAQVPAGNLPSVPGQGTYILSADNGVVAWTEFPLPQD